MGWIVNLLDQSVKSNIFRLIHYLGRKAIQIFKKCWLCKNLNSQYSQRERDLSDALQNIAPVDQIFRYRQHKNSEKQTNFDILRTVIPKRIEHTRQKIPCFSSASPAVIITFVFVFGIGQISVAWGPPVLYCKIHSGL